VPVKAKQVFKQEEVLPIVQKPVQEKEETSEESIKEAEQEAVVQQDEVMEPEVDVELKEIVVEEAEIPLENKTNIKLPTETQGPLATDFNEYVDETPLITDEMPTVPEV